MEAVEGAILSRKDGYLIVRVKSGLTYHFKEPTGDPDEIPVERIADGSGSRIDFIRTEDGLSQILTSAGHVIAVDSHDGLIRSMQLKTGDELPSVLVRYDYSPAGELLSASDPLGAPYRFEYSDHRMSGHTDRNGLTFHYRYDDSGRCIHTHGDGGLYHYDFTYLDQERTTLATDAQGNVTRLRYDENNLLLEKTDPLGNTTCYEYHERFLTSAVIDPLGRRTEYEYNESGDVTSVTRPDGARIQVEYDNRNHPVSITDPQGKVWKQQWSHDGLLISRTSPTGATTAYEYDPLGGLVAVIDPLGAKTRYEIDAGGTLSGIIDPLGNRSSFPRDLLGNILKATSPTGAQTSYSYDAASRLTKVIRPTGAEVHLAWDKEGNLTRYRDEIGNETVLEYTGIGELAKRINPDGTTVTYRSDGEERLVSVTNERGETIRITRDEAGRITGQTDYWGNLTRYEWDPAGMLAQKIDPLGDTTRYRHDPLGRLTEKLFSGGASETFAYDQTGNLIRHENSSITVERTFDDEGRLIRETQGDFIVENEYDLAGRRVKRSSSNGNTVEYAYDSVGNVSAIAINGKTVANIDRNSLGLPIKETLPNAISRNYRYDLEGRLTEEAMFGAPSKWGRRYEYDAAGNLAKRTDPLFGESFFTYDPMGRLKQAVDPEGRIHNYLHDPAGNLLKSTDEREEKTTRNLSHDGVSYRFDKAGNLVEREGKKQTTRFIWNRAGRLIEALGNNGSSTTMSYDALGRRISKETDNKKTIFAWDGDRLHSDRAPGEKPREFVYYPGSFVPFAVIEGTGKIRYYNNDVAGLPQEVRDEEGNILWQARYDAMGVVVRSKGRRRFDNPLRLQGQYYDEELGLCYNRHRYFDPHTCSFISKDPLGLMAGTNLYSYAPNVWGWVDPLGLCKGATSGIPEYTFRGDTRTPAEIFNDGLQPRGTSTDLLGYARHNDPSVFVGTSTSPKTAGGFAGEGGYVYTVRPGSSAVDVNASLGRMSPFPHETEIAVPGGISPSDIMGARQVGSAGLTGPFIKNPNYVPN